jgi:hypothetical protein
MPHSQYNDLVAGNIKNNPIVAYAKPVGTQPRIAKPVCVSQGIIAKSLQGFSNSLFNIRS